MMSAKTQRRNLDVVTAKLTQGNRAPVGILQMQAPKCWTLIYPESFRPSGMRAPLARIWYKCDMALALNRRQFVQLGALAVAGAAQDNRKKIGAISTTYFLRSHSDDIITRELEGYWINDRFYPPPVQIVS